MKSLFEHLQDFMEGWHSTWNMPTSVTTTGLVDDEGRPATFEFNPKNNRYELIDPETGEFVASFNYNVTGASFVPTPSPGGNEFAPMMCSPEDRANFHSVDRSPYTYNDVNLAYMSVGGGIQSSENADSLNGKKKGSWAVNYHMDESELNEWKKEAPDAYTENKKNLLAGWNAIKRPDNPTNTVCVVGKAGWGKSDLITSVARASGYDVILVNLSMAASEDVLGIPVPDRMATGQLRTEYAAPGWLAYIAQHPDDKICVFFDEFNQAPIDVLGTIQNFLLTRTVNGVEYKNVKFMMAGNEKSENKSLTALEDLDAISQRVYKVNWETDWDCYFTWHRDKYEKEFGKALMDEFDANKAAFKSPRNLTLHGFEWLRGTIATLKEDPTDLPIYDGQRVLNMFYRISIAKWNEAEHKFDKIDDSMQNNLSALADYVARYIYDAVTGGDTASGASGHTFSNNQREGMIPEHIEALKDAMINGQMMGDDNVFYGICRENVRDIFSEELYPWETVQRVINKLERDGVKFKYETKDDVRRELGDEIIVDIEQYTADRNGNVKKTSKKRRK